MLEDNILASQALWEKIMSHIRWFNSNADKYFTEEFGIKAKQFAQDSKAFEKSCKLIDRGMSMLNADTRQYLIDKYGPK